MFSVEHKHFNTHRGFIMIKEIIFPEGHKTQSYLLTAYLDDVRIGCGTVLDYHPAFHIISQVNEWFGKDNWNRLEFTLDKESA